MIEISRWLLLICIFGLNIPVESVFAQSQAEGEVRISKIDTFEQSEGMLLTVYFGIYDNHNGYPASGITPTNAQVTLRNTNITVPAQISRPDNPLYTLLLLDASSSMISSAALLRQAAVQALQLAPNDTYISVVQFSDSVNPLTNYTQNMSDVGNAIQGYQAKFNGGNCLYDVVYQAIESSNKLPTGRRTIILFTDGKDETNSGKPCSRHNYDDVINLATQAQTQIFTIGLSRQSDSIDTLELQGLAAETGGFSIISGQADLGTSFNLVMESLNNQWMLVSTIHPLKGDNPVSIQVQTDDNFTHLTTLMVSSDTDYKGLSDLAQCRFDGLIYDAERNLYQLRVTLAALEQVAYLKIMITNEDGLTIAELNFSDLGIQNSLPIQADELGLVPGNKYVLQISAISQLDRTPLPCVADDQGKISMVILHEFVHHPINPTIDILTVSQENNNLILTLNLTNHQKITGYDGWLVNEGGTVQVGSNFLVNQLESENRLTMQLYEQKVPAGVYTVVVRGLGTNGQMLDDARQEDVVYEPVYPSLVDEIREALSKNPWIIVVMIFLVLSATATISYLSNREQSRSGTPVLDGEISASPHRRPHRRGILPVNPDPITVQEQARQRSIATQSKLRSNSHYMSKIIENSDMAVLVCTRSINQTQLNGKCIPIRENEFIIGRQDGTLVISDPKVSRKHIQINYDPGDGTYALTDLGSSNGTVVNGRHLIPHQPVNISDGAQIEIGPNISFTFEIRRVL